MQSLLSTIRDDLKANTHFKSKFVLILFRIANSSLSLPRPFRTLAAPYRIFYRILVDWFMGIDIPCRVSLGRRPVLYHSHALVINEAAQIGDDCIFRHCVTLGNKISVDGESEAPIIGNRVEFGVGSSVIGPVRIGDDVVIGAHSLVNKSVEPGLVVIGIPARPFRRTSP